jgi:cell division topological specificity factor
MAMSFLTFLFGRKKKSACLAKERLQILLAQDRSARRPRGPEYLPALQRELLGVVSKYVSIQPKDISVSLERQRNVEVLEVKIALPEAARA